MVVPPHADKNGSTIEHPDVCPPYDDEITSGQKHPIPSNSTEKYDWSQELQGLILSSFYWVMNENFYKHLSLHFKYFFIQFYSS